MTTPNLFHRFAPCGCFDKFDHQQESFIAEFQHWFLILNHQQGFLGRSLLILKSHKVDEAELNQEQVLEKHVAYCTWRHAIKSAFQPDKINQAQLGNEAHLHGGHLHWHFVPRYWNPVTFGNKEFPGEKPEDRKLNYSRIADRTVHPLELRVKIKNELVKQFPRFT